MPVKRWSMKGIPHVGKGFKFGLVLSLSVLMCMLWVTVDGSAKSKFTDEQTGERTIITERKGGNKTIIKGSAEDNFDNAAQNIMGDSYDPEKHQDRFFGGWEDENGNRYAVKGEQNSDGSFTMELWPYASNEDQGPGTIDGENMPGANGRSLPLGEGGGTKSPDEFPPPPEPVVDSAAEQLDDGTYANPIEVEFSKGDADGHSIGGGRSDADTLTKRLSSSGEYTITHTLYYDEYKKDEEGNKVLIGTQETSTTYTYKLDLTPPNEPPTGDMNTDWSDKPVDFTLTGGNDEHSGVKGYEYSINGNLGEGSSGTALNESGQAVVFGRAVDFTGRTSEWFFVGIARVDMTVPKIIFSPNGGTHSGNETKITQVMVYDEHSGLDESSLQYAWSPSDTQQPTQWEAFNNGRFIEKKDTLGEFYLWIKAKDNVQNEAIVVSEMFYIDNKIVKLNIEEAIYEGKKGYTVENVAGYIDEFASHVFKLSDIEIEDGNILLRDDNTGDMRVREDFLKGLQLNIQKQHNEILEVSTKDRLKPKLLQKAPPGYSEKGNNIAFVEVTYDLIQRVNNERVILEVGFLRENGVVTPKQEIDFLILIEERLVDSN